MSAEFSEGTGPGQGHPHADAAGSIGMEAGKLLAAAQEWAQHAFGSSAETPLATTGATTCEWCPICQFVAVLRGERPETTEKIAVAGATLLTLLRSLLDALQQPPSAPAQPSGPRVQPIDLGAE